MKPNSLALCDHPTTSLLQLISAAMSTMHSIILSWMLLALGICTSAQHTIVELQPVEVVCSGSVISTITQ